MRKMLFGENNLLVSDVTKVVYTEHFNWALVDVDVNKIDKLNEGFKQELTDEMDLERYLESLGYTEINIISLGESVAIKEAVIFDYESQEFFDLDNCEYTFRYEWYDGSNWVSVYADEYTELILDDSTIDLDEYDGSNWHTGGIGYHAYIQKIIEIDAKPVTEHYLLVEYSQWQGTHSTGKVLSKEELAVALTNIDRAEYIREID